MKKTAILFADGYEEVEALTVVDLLRRAKIGCDIVALEESSQITGSHGISVGADKTFSQLNVEEYDGLILPGGLRGVNNLAADERVLALLRRFAEAGKLTAAICAGPTVLAKAGLLQGRKATCYPGMEDQLTGTIACTEPVVADGNILTSRGLGTAIPFALALVAYFSGEKQAQALAKSIVFQ
ncbi:MAG: DJ-1 family glyoxalase III [Candidatus Limivicinus sp.]